MDAYETITGRHGLSVEIIQDELDMDPRREWDHLGRMFCWHGRYNLGDEHEYRTPWGFVAERYDELNPDAEYEDIEEHFSDDLGAGLDACGIYCLPLYLYDHSGITMNTTGFSCRWDSGEVGFIYMDKATAARECPEGLDVEEWAEAFLRGEVEEYDQYLTGDVWGYLVMDRDGEGVDSCWGFYGLDYARGEARAALQFCEQEQDRADVDAWQSFGFATA